MSLRADVEQRWRTRVVPNGWDRIGRDGGVAYLKKYGKGISVDKLTALAQCARDKGCEEMAQAFDDAIKDIRIAVELEKI